MRRLTLVGALFPITTIIATLLLLPVLSCAFSLVSDKSVSRPLWRPIHRATWSLTPTLFFDTIRSLYESFAFTLLYETRRRRSRTIRLHHTNFSSATPLATHVTAFLTELEGRNCSPHTIAAYRRDLNQFLTYLHENSVIAATAQTITRSDIAAFLAALGRAGLTGTSRARKLAVLRAFFSYLEAEDVINRSPARGIAPPKSERRERGSLRPHEYAQLLAAAGGDTRDFAILQLFLQTGLRLSELCSLMLADIDLPNERLPVRAGKGKADATVYLEAKSLKALSRYLDERGAWGPAALFLNRYGEPLSTSGVKKLVKHYVRAAGLPDWVSCHTLRHTYSTIKAERGVGALALQKLMRHARLQTTTIYTHHRAESLAKIQKRTSL